METLTLGYIPLVDAAPLIVAQQLGFAAQERLELRLAREISWANIRDRVIVGHFDAAHMLAPMAIASSLGLGALATPMIAPFSLALGGNAITLSLKTIAAMQDAGAGLDAGPAALARALAVVVRGGAALTLAVVHPFSAHNYELRYWLAFAGLDPDRDLSLVTLPPSLMADALREGRIDGFCAGEPWNSLAVEAGLGAIAVLKSELWPLGPDKALAARADFPERRPQALPALLRALHAAAAWADAPDNHAELAALLARPEHLDVAAPLLARALTGRLLRRAGATAEVAPDFLAFSAHAANFPWRSHALWFAAQMARWGQIVATPDVFARAAAVYRPDLYRAALRPLGVDAPLADMKVEGALTAPTPTASRLGEMKLGPDAAFDGRRFDPQAIPAYLAGFAPPVR